MTASELIAELAKAEPDAKVWFLRYHDEGEDEWAVETFWADTQAVVLS